MPLNFYFSAISMESTVYDYAIIGAGAAGLHLAIAMKNDPYFEDKELLIIEKDEKNTNDKTWCFWEKGSGNWDAITTKIWAKTEFITSKKNLTLPLSPYLYKMVRALDFYQHAKAVLSTKNNITWVRGSADYIHEGTINKIETTASSYQARHIFDSRIDKKYFQNNDDYIRLLQHFKGWVIETDEPVFDAETFTMMDFRLKYPESTSFIYILPLSKNKALIEFTFFSPKTVQEEEYEDYMHRYIKKLLKVKAYTIVEEEQGIIPMSNFPFHEKNNPSVTKIGTAGSWVKASTGYSFKNAERYSHTIVNNIKNGLAPAHELFSRRFRFYDAIFLSVLFHHNQLGEQVFSDMYSKNSIEKIFRFLDESTTIAEELKIISSFEWWPFTKALVRQVF